MIFNKILTCDVKVVHVLVLKLSDLTTCTVQIQSRQFHIIDKLLRCNTDRSIMTIRLLRN